MNWIGIAGIFAALYVPTIGFAVKGLIQYITSEDEQDQKQKQGKLSFLLGAVGTIFVTILLAAVIIWNSIDPDPNPSPYAGSSITIPTPNRDESIDPDHENKDGIALDGGTYNGEVDPVSNEPNGTGTMEYSNGDTYKGNWKNGKCHGEGTMTYANGDVYSGEWANGEKNGFGVYTWSDGRVYEGNYKDNQRDGKGEYHGWTGFTTVRGGWKGTYYGTSVGNVFEGDGVFEFDNGDRFEGTFQNNKFWKGTITYQDGTQSKVNQGTIG